MEKYAKKRILAFLVLGLINSQNFSNVYASEELKRGFLAVLPAAILVAAGYYYGYQSGFYHGKEAERNEAKARAEKPHNHKELSKPLA